MANTRKRKRRLRPEIKTAMLIGILTILFVCLFIFTRKDVPEEPEQPNYVGEDIILPPETEQSSPNNKTTEEPKEPDSVGEDIILPPENEESPDDKTTEQPKQPEQPEQPKEPDSVGEDIILPPKTEKPVTPIAPKQPYNGEDARLSFVAFGDNLIHSAIIEDGERLAKESGRTEKYYFDPMYENFKDIVSSADIAFINQETPIAGPDFPAAGYPNFNTPNEMGDTLVRLGFDVINTATNHMLDCRGKGLVHHVEYWEGKADQGVIQVGSYRNKSEYNNIRVIDREGVKIAFLGYTYGTNGMTAGSSYPDIYVPLPDKNEMTRQVQEARAIADLVFVSMHWGDEDSFEPNATQRDWAQCLVDAGADVIIGTHPHVIQEMKWKENAEGHKTLLVYSLGNFISTMYYPWNMFGAYLSLDIVADASGVRVENPKFNPTMCHYNMNRRALKLYTMDNYSQDLYNTHGTTLKSSAYSYNKIIAKYKSVVSEEFLPDYIKEYNAN